MLSPSHRPFLLLVAAALAGPAPAAPPNVLFIAVDDLNDWVGCLGGHPQAQTPNIDRLAARGVNFTNAHCQAPICNPSRTCLMTGRLPSTTGVYYLKPLPRDCASTRDLVTLPQHFAANGYWTMAAGKLFHQADGPEFDEHAGGFGGFGPRPKKPLSAGHTHPLWDWGVFPKSDRQMPDAKIAAWATRKLRQDHDQPFFLAVGFHRPHVPLYAPQQWFDKFPLETIELPAVARNDLDDVPEYGRDLSWSRVAPRHRWMVENGQWRRAVQAYLASIAFVDAQVGKVLDALAASDAAENTVVVLWSDHGFHLGTKERWGKRSLWESSTRVVLTIKGPGIRGEQRCDEPVGLIDLYPTLCELCGIEPPAGLEGRSLGPQLADASAARERPALTTFGQNNHAVRTRHWRYIRYADGAEELYDHRGDPGEFHNLAGDAAVAGVIAEHRRWLPTENAPMAPGSAHADARPGSAADIDGPH
ncbi:MAG: sulfatase [Planctomycetota bacterium]